MAKKFDMSQAQLWTILNAQQNKKQQTNSPSKEVKKFDMSEAQLWAILNAQQNKKQQTNSPSDEKRDSFIEFFNTHLFEHLKKEHDPNGNANQPSKIIKDAQSSIGALSRIFDEYDCPTPNYEEINTIYQKPNGLREHIQENLKGILPVLLNEDRTALHPTVIDAIGPDNYKEILKNAQGDEQAIAEQFVQAVISGYGQRILQNTDDNDLKLKLYTSVLPALEMLNKEVTLQGLPEQSKPIPAVILTNISSDFINLLEAAEKDGIKSKLFENAKSELDSVVARFNDKHEDHKDYMDESEEVKNAKGLESYNKAVDFVIRGITDSLADKPPEPKEVSWFKKFLRFITCNEKLLQNADEKAHEKAQDRYEKQRDRLLTLIPKIINLDSKLKSYAKDEHQVTQDCRSETPITFRHQ
ncbi:TPA: hypothetical protein ACG3NF_000767 [Legionella pneumophila]|uniref:hypothetical protein n=1 Tax=Legionella pneumophila TaxID=446 RepID=UPI000770AAC3|nr:hypothetical protein [Legionella pneumophila]HAT9274223.1 hypothetical protein [Legionella pneumophila subsp. pneumophila]MCO1452083.1 hypothetical protein [Legionella pneumophila]MCW8458088.1 hypothetical protein [Legionella pneumophila]MCZ4721497.1 hypothetical protein [Legionella pneumophila]MCZ4729297.1 hypothetical protein [Legionella pneumophila]